MSPKLDSVPRMVNPIISGVLIFWRLKKIDLAGAMPETSSGASKRPRSASPVAKDDSCGDTIKPEIAAKRCVAAVSKPRVNERATSVTDLTVEQLMTEKRRNEAARLLQGTVRGKLTRKQARASGGARAQIAAGRSMARVRFISSGGYPARLAPSVYATIG